MTTSGTRSRKPADQRRRELAEVAAGHFHRYGFHGVSLAAVAADVGITAPAVYRHFRNKNALLSGAISTGLDHVDAGLAGAGSLDEAVDRLAGAALARPDVWVLLQREMRHLDDDARSAATARFRTLAAAFADHVRRARPDLDEGRSGLLTTAAFAVLATPSVRPVPLGHERYRRALAGIARAVCAAEIPTGTAVPGPAPAARPDDRLLDAAVGLFQRYGYAAVRIDDIGAAAGIAGPSVYHHFGSKMDMLVRAFRQAAALRPDPAGHDLDSLVRSYVDVVMAERELFGVYATEELHLPPDARREHETSLGEQTRRWVSTLRSARPELDDTERELLAHAARAIAHDVARVGRLHTRPAVADETTAVALRAVRG
ncbi:TetR/AcrR family transcriptional regulator [Pseudonocardia endophytica]|nr:TetR/AcrR family transcriptional regulator [Pseudonocardia endophytica]